MHAQQGLVVRLYRLSAPPAGQDGDLHLPRGVAGGALLQPHWHAAVPRLRGPGLRAAPRDDARREGGRAPVHGLPGRPLPGWSSDRRKVATEDAALTK